MLALVLSVYAIASLEPFDWQIPRQVPNHAGRTPDGWRFAASGIVVAEPPHDWLEAAGAAETLGLSLVVRSLAAVQSGPARILTMSRDAQFRNLTIAQEDDDLVLRLRTEDSDPNGLIAGAPFARLEGVFGGAGWLTIDLRLRPRQLTIALDGQTVLNAALPPAVVRTWQPWFSLALGNELTCDRPWLGEIRAAVVTAPDWMRDYAAAEAMHAPATCWTIRYLPALVPFRLFLPGDAIRNTLMYGPLGLLLGLMARSSSAAAFFGRLLVILGISVGFESAQLLVQSRFPAVDDVICNAIGGGLGLALALYGRRLTTAITAFLPARARR
jgi:hypothetical protein